MVVVFLGVDATKGRGGTGPAGRTGRGGRQAGRDPPPHKRLTQDAELDAEEEQGDTVPLKQNDALATDKACEEPSARKNLSLALCYLLHKLAPL